MWSFFDFDFVLESMDGSCDKFEDVAGFSKRLAKL